MFCCSKWVEQGGRCSPVKFPPTRTFWTEPLDPFPFPTVTSSSRYMEPLPGFYCSAAPWLLGCMPYWITAPTPSPLLWSVPHPVCGGGHVPCQSGLHNGGAAEAEQHGEYKFWTNGSLGRFKYFYTFYLFLLQFSYCGRGPALTGFCSCIFIYIYIFFTIHLPNIQEMWRSSGSK